MHMAQHGISTNVWCRFGNDFSGNIVFNLIFGIVGDKLAGKIPLFGSAESARHFHRPIILCTCFLRRKFSGCQRDRLYLGGLLAGYVPIGAIVPTVAGKDKGAAMSVLNLAAGLSAFVGPALAWLFIGLIGRKVLSGSLRSFILRVRS